MSSTARRILRWIGKALLGLVVALLALAVVGVIYLGSRYRTWRAR
jgi:hypothetical protein